MNTTVICGAPRAGKSTLARAMLQGACPGTMLWHLDTLIESHTWSEQSEAALTYLESPHPAIIEGCAAARALRKFLERRDGAPCTSIVRMTGPLCELSKGQNTLARGEATIWAQIEHELSKRGVTVSYLF